MKLFVFDLETTGVKHWRNGIHQISGMIVIDGVIKEEFDFKVQPYEKAEIELEALKVANISFDDLKTYDSMVSVYSRIVAMLKKYVNKFDKKDKMFLVGYNNAAFDNAFFKAFFVQNKDDYFFSWFWSSAIDVMVLASQKLMPVRHEMENFKLMTVAKQLGIEVNESKLHDAQYDIELTYQIYNLIK